MPDEIDNLFRQAVAALRAQRLADAERVCRQVLKKRKKHLDALSMMAHIAINRLDFAGAESYLKQCLALRPKEPYLHQQLAKVHATQGRFREAITRFDRILKLAPRDPAAIAGKAAALERKGDDARARALLDPIVAAGGETPEMAVTYTALLAREHRDDDVIALATKHLERADVAPDYRAALCTALGRAHERAGAYDRAFAAYRDGNAVHPVSFDAARLARTRDELIAAFAPATFAELPRAASASRLPVFIVGTARSGTTLLDRIIDAHPKAAGIGETELVRDLVKRIAQETGAPRVWPGCVHDLAQGDVDRLSRSIADVFTRRAAGGRQRVADKSISNFSHVGLIALLFPDAPIIHVRRDPLDACFSMFAEPLPVGVHPYSNDLRNIGVYYRQYVRLMDHWRGLPGVRMFEVRYEDLVNDPQRWIPEVIAYCGLEWDDACLRFHETGRAAATISYDQVRRPIYTSSVGRAERFRAHLGPLIDALGT